MKNRTLEDFKREAALSADYFISRGYDAQGRDILYPRAYENAAQERAERDYEDYVAGLTVEALTAEDIAQAMVIETYEKDHK